METSEVRINKFLSEAGVCSRREADRRILAGDVLIDGRAAVMGDKVSKKQSVVFCGKTVQKEEERILLAVNKPAGIICTAEKREKNNIVDFINYPKRIFPVGRLDKDSTGLILMTNQGDIVNKMMRSGNLHEKEYIVCVNKRIAPEFIAGMANGVHLKELDTVTRKCEVKQTGDRTFHIILTQGLNRQIRRMCEFFNYSVVELKRIRIMNIELGDLEPGTYRRITKTEWEELNSLIRRSSNETVIPNGKRDSNEGAGRRKNKGAAGTD